MMPVYYVAGIKNGQDTLRKPGKNEIELGISHQGGITGLTVN